MKQISLLCLSLIISVSGIFAQNDKRAQDILNEVSQKYRSFQTIKAEFKYTLESRADNFKEELSGTLFLKDEKFKITFGDQVIVCDNKYIWTYLKDINEVQINTFNPKDLEVIPSEMFTIYEKGFLYKYMGEEKSREGKTLQVIDLTPHDKNQSYFKVRLLVDRPSGQITTTQIFEKNGNIYTYEILKLIPNQSLGDNMFQFAPRDYPGVVVVDLR